MTSVGSGIQEVTEVSIRLDTFPGAREVVKVYHFPPPGQTARVMSSFITSIIHYFDGGKEVWSVVRAGEILGEFHSQPDAVNLIVELITNNLNGLRNKPAKKR